MGGRGDEGPSAGVIKPRSIRLKSAASPLDKRRLADPHQETPTVTRTRLIAAAAALLLLCSCSPAGAQGEGDAPSSYVIGEDGVATHNATGAVCPAMIGELTLVQVLSYDREGSHLGIGCQYASARGWTSSISLLRADEPNLVGVGDSGARWNRSLYSILSSYPNALPANVAGIEGDQGSGLRGALFTANGNGVPVRLGVWQYEDASWQYRATAMFTPTAEGGWTLAEQTRAALVAAKTAADRN
jgi:hypothetical protein